MASSVSRAHIPWDTANKTPFPATSANGTEGLSGTDPSDTSCDIPVDSTRMDTVTRTYDDGR